MLMSLPKDYFILLDSRDYPKSSKPPIAGAQRVGFEWYVFADPDALSRMVNDGVFGRQEIPSCSDCESKDSEISSLEDSLASAEDDLSNANKTIARLEREMAELQKGKAS